MSVENKVIEIANLSCSFREQDALDDVSLTVPKGSVFGLVGLNGAGKTTLIRFLLGALKASPGCVKVLGQDPTIHPENLLSRVGYVPEEDASPRWLRVGEYLDFRRTFYPTWDDSLCRDMLERFEIARSQSLADLSKGGRARISLLSAVCHHPELLILDEPSYGLDPIARQEILETIIQTASDEQRTVFFSSHLLDEVSRVCEKVALIHQGRIREVVALAELSDRYGDFLITVESDVKQPPHIEGLFGWQKHGNDWLVAFDRGRWSPETLSETLRSISDDHWRPKSLEQEVRPLSLERWFSARVSERTPKNKSHKVMP